MASPLQATTSAFVSGRSSNGGNSSSKPLRARSRARTRAKHSVAPWSASSCVPAAQLVSFARLADSYSMTERTLPALPSASTNAFAGGGGKLHASSTELAAAGEIAPAQSSARVYRYGCVGHERRVQSALQALLQQKLESEARTKAAQNALEVSMDQLSTSRTILRAKHAEKQRTTGALRIQCQVRGRQARKVVMKKREAVRKFIEHIMQSKKNVAVLRIQRVYRQHLKKIAHAIKRRKKDEERAALRCIIKLQAFSRSLRANRIAHFQRLRRQSSAQHWTAARTRIRMAIASINPDAHSDSGDTSSGRNEPEGEGAGVSLRSRKASCLPNTLSASVGQAPINTVVSAEGGLAPTLLFSTNMALCGRAVHVEIWENCGMLEIRGKYYTSRARFAVHITEREYRRFGYGNLEDLSMEEKQELCSSISKDLWDTETLFESSSQLIEKVLIEQMPMISEMKESLRDKITTRVTTRIVREGEEVIKEGELVRASDDAIFFVKTGKLELFVDGVRVRQLVSGDFFGERALIVTKHYKREMTVSAIQTCELLCLSRHDFSTILKQHPQYERNVQVLKASADRLVQASLASNVCMPPDLRERICDHVMMRLHTKAYKPNELVVQQGDNDDDGMYFVREGSLSVMMHGKELRTLGDGDFFGEKALLTPEGIRTATVRTKTHCVLLALSRDGFKSIVQQHPEYARNLEILHVSCKQLVSNVISKRMGVTADIEHAILDYIAARVCLKRFKAGEIVVEEGNSDADGLYFVRSGELSVLTKGNFKRRLQRFSYFGERSLVGDVSKRTATVVAVDEVELLNLTKRDFNNIVKLHPEYQQQLEQLKKTCEKLVSNVITRIVPLSDQGQMDVVDHVMARLRYMRVQPSQTVMAEGATGSDGMYFVQSGTLDVLVGGRHVRQLSAGDFFGERALLAENGIRTATVEAGSSGAELLNLSCEDFLHIIDFQPEYQANMALLQNAMHDLVMKALPPGVQLPCAVESQVTDFVLSRATVSTWDAREVVVREGDVDDSGMFFVRQGELSVSIRKKHIRTLSRGDFFGELALVSKEGRRTASVTCLTNCKLLSLSRNEFRSVMAEVLEALGVVAHSQDRRNSAADASMQMKEVHADAERRLTNMLDGHRPDVHLDI